MTTDQMLLQLLSYCIYGRAAQLQVMLISKEMSRFHRNRSNVRPRLQQALIYSM